MKETVCNENTLNTPLVYSESFWTGARSLSYGDVPLQKTNNRTFSLLVASAKVDVEQNTDEPTVAETVEPASGERQDDPKSAEDKQAAQPVPFTVSGNRFSGVQVSSPLFAAPVQVVRKLTPLEYVLAILVFIPGLVFGAVGGAVGAVIACLHYALMIRVQKTWLKIVLCVEFVIVAAFTAFWLAFAVGMLFW